MKFKRKNPEIEAIQFTGDNALIIKEFAGKAFSSTDHSDNIDIKNQYGLMRCKIGDYVVKEKNPVGFHVFVQTAEMFEFTYRPIK